MTEPLHPSQNRGLRELYAAARQVESHWSRLGRLLDVDELADGALTAGALVGELEAYAFLPQPLTLVEVKRRVVGRRGRENPLDEAQGEHVTIARSI